MGLKRSKAESWTLGKDLEGSLHEAGREQWVGAERLVKIARGAPSGRGVRPVA